MARHTARRLTSAIFGLTLVGVSSIAFAGAATADPNKNITICHATGSAKNPFVVITVDAASIVKENGHSQHQDKRDVIPPFEYIAENGGATVSFAGLNWDDNWETNGEGVATEEVDEEDCEAPGRPTKTPTPTVTTTPSGTATPTSTPTGPVVETDLVEQGGSNLALVGGGAALLLAGAATTAAAVLRRRGSHT